MEGAHPLILERMLCTNMEKTAGYGCDDICASARERIRRACAAPDAEVHFLVGGTQTNATVIKALLRPYEGVVAADTGHVSVHEAGAVEATGHKVIALPHSDGKLTAAAVEGFVEAFDADESRDHMVWPGMVYISHPTEYGTLYSLAELEALAAVCRRYGMPLFLDGARLGYALASPSTDVALADIARLCDAFYIGGTKVGALFGEAVVMRAGLVRHFFTTVKQQGALLAKGWLLGLQFDTLFADGLYIRIARHAVEMAALLRDGLVGMGFEEYRRSPTNQIFLVLDVDRLRRLAAVTTFSEWERLPDGRTVVRLATSWATRREDVEALLGALEREA